MGPQNILHMPLLERYSPEKKTNHQHNPSKVQMELTPAKHRRDPSRKSHYPAANLIQALQPHKWAPHKWAPHQGYQPMRRQLGHSCLLTSAPRESFAGKKIKIKIKIPSVIPCIMQGSQVNVDKKRIV